MNTSGSRGYVWLTAVAALISCFYIVGCGVFESGGSGESGSGGKVLDDYLEGDISDLNSTTTTDGYSFNVLNNFTEGLYRLDENHEPVPAQAKSVEVGDGGTTYTFKLRDGIEWSDGSPVTSQDFRYAWLRAMDPDTAGAYSFILSDFIEGGAEFAAGDTGPESVGIETPDDETLVARLANPTPFFLSLTAFPTYMPLEREFVEKQGDRYAQSADSILYNGPYTMTEFEPTNRVVLEKNGRYWDKENVDVERVKVRVIKENETALNLYQAGDLDIVGLTSGTVEEFQDSPQFSTVTNFETLILYMNNEDPALANENVRKAIQRGFDREAYVENILANGSRAAYGLVPPGMAGPGNQSFREYVGDTIPSFDPSEARGLYEQGVEELGREPTIEISVSDDDTSRDTGTFLQSQLEENLGANVEVKTLPFDALLEAAGSGEYQITASTWIADFNDPINYLDLFASQSGFNYPNFDSGRYDHLIAGTKTEAGQKERMRLMAEAERLLLTEEAAIDPVYYSATARLIKPYVKGYVDHPYGPATDYKYVEIER